MGPNSKFGFLGHVVPWKYHVTTAHHKVYWEKVQDYIRPPLTCCTGSFGKNWDMVGKRPEEKGVGR